MGVWRKFWCRMGHHRSLNVIQTFGAAQHIGCPDCGRELAIHHGMQAVVPWTPEFAALYQDMGYDTEGATEQWRRWRRNRAALRTA